MHNNNRAAHVSRKTNLFPRAVIEAVEARLHLSASHSQSQPVALDDPRVAAQPGDDLPAAMWTGDGGNNNWQTAGNWQGDTVPASGQAVDFPANNSAFAQVNLASPVTVGDMEVDGAYIIEGDNITLAGNITSNGTGTEIGSTTVLGHNVIVSVGASDDFTILASNDGGNHFGITKQGAGMLYLAGESGSYTGITEVVQGSLEVDTDLASTVKLDSGTSLSGNGSPGAILGNGGTVSLRQGTEANSVGSGGNISFGNGSTLQAYLAPPMFSFMGGVQTGTLYASGSSVNLTGGNLDVMRASGATPSLGFTWTLISNHTGNPIIGTFNSLPEGAITTIDGIGYRISYVGGAGNDVTLTVVPAVASASKLAIVNQPSGAAIAGQSIGTVVVDVEDANGNLVTSNNSAVTLSVLDGTPLSGATTVTAVNGVATFSDLSIAKTGNYTLSATDATLAAAASNSLSITAAAAAQMAFASQPGDSAAGQAIGTIAVNVEDAFGNLVTTDDSTVTLSTSDDALLSGPASVAAVSGVATFDDLSMTQPGTRTLSAADASLTPASSDLFSIFAGPAVKLAVVQQPAATAITGQSIGTLIVAVEDAYGNIVGSDNSSVTVAAQSADAPAGAGSVLTGTTTIAVHDGVAVFSDLAVGASGAYTLFAADGALLSASTNSVTVSDAPNVVAAGTAIAPMVIDPSTAFTQPSVNLKRVIVRVTSEESGKTVIVNSIRAKNGQVTVSNLRIHKAGVYNVLISDSQGQTMTSQVSVVPSAPAKLAFAGKPSSVNGVTTVAVKVLDRYGNLTTAADGTVVTLHLKWYETLFGLPHLASNTPALNGTITATIANGIAEFPDVSITRPGVGQLIATADDLANGYSALFYNA